MPNSLHQMTMSYSATEDRLLLRVSTTANDEHQIWLTRRFVKMLWPALFKGVEKQSLPPETAAAPTTTPQVKRAVMAMQHNEALQKTDMTQQHDEKKVNKRSTYSPIVFKWSRALQNSKSSIEIRKCVLSQYTNTSVNIINCET